MKHANPQGKGLVPALQAWNDTRPARATSPRPVQSLLADFCASSLVLAARFEFRPVPGNRYHLYKCGDIWRLSLIAPQEWGSRQPGIHIARCDLRRDMTWSLVAAEGLAESPEVVEALERHMEAFLAAVNTEEPLTDTLPFHVSELPFYPRLMASALARSLRDNLQVNGLDAASGRTLLTATESPARLLDILPPQAASS
ncbi:DUF2452 domain-containing protein [Chromatocurvus halotolerans]|uniref:Uncharacterized protein DUF2452 n=1 Tax=Chromatocurvus halotolerans TaxID=1132028 RepID=A0A4R2KX00_9GAMM|nr:DUF2452 domain-containing protein [Chromatocurvus halotolerans]TCO75829.1 uncharacterized protein DUF2452 [Chromatocurvus halotolerans]